MAKKTVLKTEEQTESNVEPIPFESGDSPESKPVGKIKMNKDIKVFMGIYTAILTTAIGIAVHFYTQNIEKDRALILELKEEVKTNKTSISDIKTSVAILVDRQRTPK